MPAQAVFASQLLPQNEQRQIFQHSLAVWGTRRLQDEARRGWEKMKDEL